MKSQAIQKIDSELKVYNGDRYGKVMKDYIAGILKDFCQQNEEFAQAVVQGGSFEDCMKAVTKDIKGSAITDLDACKAAAAFYFPGCVVEFHMSIHMSKFEAEEQPSADSGIMLRLEDFL